MSSPSNNSKDRSKKRRTHKQPMTRIMLSISPGILEMVDEAAKKDFTSRSDIVRTALLWYLRPQGRELDQADPDQILKTLEKRRARQGWKEMFQDLDDFDG